MSHGSGALQIETHRESCVGVAQGDMPNALTGYEAAARLDPALHEVTHGRKENERAVGQSEDGWCLPGDGESAREGAVARAGHVEVSWRRERRGEFRLG